MRSVLLSALLLIGPLAHAEPTDSTIRELQAQIDKLHQQLAESEAAREELLRGGAQDSSGLQARTLRLSQENQRLKLQLKQSQTQAEPPLLDERQQWFVIGAGCCLLSVLAGALIGRSRRSPRQWLN